MPRLGPLVLAVWVGAVGALAGGAAGAGGLIGGAALGLAGIAFLQSLYPIEGASLGLRTEPEGVRYRLDGTGAGVLPWVLAAGSAIVAALAGGVAEALPIDAAAAVIAVLGAGLWAALASVAPSVEVSLGAHALSIRRGWVGLGRARVLTWDEVGCAVLSTADHEAELVVAGTDGPLIRTGLRAPAEDLTPIVEEIEAHLARRAATPPVAVERAALQRLLGRAAASR